MEENIDCVQNLLNAGVEFVGNHRLAKGNAMGVEITLLI